MIDYKQMVERKATDDLGSWLARISGRKFEIGSVKIVQDTSQPLIVEVVWYPCKRRPGEYNSIRLPLYERDDVFDVIEKFSECIKQMFLAAMEN